MADLAVVTTSYQVENRSWLLSSHGTEITPSATFDVSAFTAATHYPNGYLLSGIAVARLTSGGKFVPYVDAGSGGQGVLYGYIFSAVKVPNTADTTIDTAGAVLVHGVVSESKLLTTPKSSTCRKEGLKTHGNLLRRPG
jgi:hypothetical protein